MVINNSERRLRTAFVLFPAIFSAGLFFPALFKKALNRRLNKIQGFYGNIQQINFSLKGYSVTLKYFSIHKIDEGGRRLLSFSADSIQLKLNWMALWKGELITEVFISSPTFNFVKSSDVHNILRSPFKIDIPVEIYHLKVTNGTVEFIDKETKPEIKLKLHEISIEGSNLTNIENKHEQLSAKVNVIGNIDTGKLKADIKTGFFEEMPAFEVNMEIINLDMKQLNNIFKAYGNFDVNKGNLGLYTEISSRDGKFKGYVEPIIKELEVLGTKDLHKGFFSLVWETVVAIGTMAIENKGKKEIATKIPFEGNLKSVKVNTWYAISETLLNAFVHALRPSIDFDISINSITKNTPD